MQKYADYITQIEIDSLWAGKRHILWNLDPKVNVLSGMNGEGKSTILNKVVKSLSTGGEFPSHMLKGVRLKVFPEDAKWIRYDVIRSMDNPALDKDTMARIGEPLVSSEIDFRLYQLQRRYLAYQVNIGNRIIEIIQGGSPDAAAKAQDVSKPKERFLDMIDTLFENTSKSVVRGENEIWFTQHGERLSPYKLSSGEKQMLSILLTVLVEDKLPYVLFLDEPEISLHLEWQNQLIDMITELNPNAQVILTTHAPGIIAKGWGDKVTEVIDIVVSEK